MGGHRSGKGGHHRSGKGTGKGYSKGGESKFQVMLGGEYKDYSKEEDVLLKKAWMVGNPRVRYEFREQWYQYDFDEMTQKNITHGEQGGKVRQIRQPYNFPPRPTTSLLPHGPMVVITVKPGQAGTVIQVPDPSNPGQTVPVHVPPGAKPGQKMAVPMPLKGETVDQLQDKQKKYEEEEKRKGKWSTGGKVAATGAALLGVGAVGVGGVILGDHLAGGDMASDIADFAVDVGEHIGDVGEDAIEAIGDVGEDVIDAIGDFGEDAIDWFGDAGEDVGDFIMDLF